MGEMIICDIVWVMCWFFVCLLVFQKMMFQGRGLINYFGRLCFYVAKGSQELIPSAQNYS